AFTGAQFLMPLTNPLDSTIFDYADPCVLVLDEPEVLREAQDKFFSALQQRYQQTEAAGGIALAPENLFLQPENFEERRRLHPLVQLEEIGAVEVESGSSERPPSVFSVPAQPAPKWHGRIKDLAEDVRRAHTQGIQVVLLGSTLGMAERLRDLLHEYD